MGLVGPASQWRWWGRGDARVRAGSAAAEGGARHIGSSRRPCAETDRPSPAAPAPRASSVAALGDSRPLTVPLAQAVGPEEGDRVWFMSAPRGLRGGGGVHVAGERFARGLLTGPRPWPPGLLRKAEMSSRTPSERLLSAPAGTDVSPPHQKPPPLPLPALRPPQRRLQGEPPSAPCCTLACRSPLPEREADVPVQTVGVTGPCFQRSSVCCERLPGARVQHCVWVSSFGLSSHLNLNLTCQSSASTH